MSKFILSEGLLANTCHCRAQQDWGGTAAYKHEVRGKNKHKLCSVEGKFIEGSYGSSFEDLFGEQKWHFSSQFCLPRHQVTRGGGRRLPVHPPPGNRLRARSAADPWCSGRALHRHPAPPRPVRDPTAGSAPRAARDEGGHEGRRQREAAGSEGTTTWRRRPP